MSSRPFVHLHNHTEFSLLDGAQKIPEMIRRAKTLGMSAVAMTDHGNLFGAVRFYKEARKEQLRPILGCEVYVAPRSRFDKHPGQGRGKPYYHLVLLAKNRQGFRNLVKLTSLGYLEGFYYRPRVDKELLRRHGEGLIALTACLAGEVPQPAASRRYRGRPPDRPRVPGDLR
ncbi:MAG: PHP domain-containing protein [Acidobacteriota bacterium]|nr:PHP domain-containing protein [Acidobacteriota bacterium]